MKPRILVLALLSLGCAHAQAPAPGGTDANLLARGRAIAETHCASCHAIGGDGVSRHPQAPPFRTFSENYPVTALEEAFAEGILVGHPAMPEFRLEPDEIDALLAYIQSVQTRGAG
ncbi:MAG: cytochrome c [Hyphomonadaceae bacterium]